MSDTSTVAPASVARSLTRLIALVDIARSINASDQSIPGPGEGSDKGDKIDALLKAMAVELQEACAGCES